jgi:hypothetical protein
MSRAFVRKSDRDRESLRERAVFNTDIAVQVCASVMRANMTGTSSVRKTARYAPTPAELKFAMDTLAATEIRWQ